jgi:hypothetical protein
MGGEILSGGKQDRIVGRDVIIGPRKRNRSIPVFCVEQGRWQVKSKQFYSKKNLGTHKLRYRAQSGESATQSKIWGEIAESNERLGVESKTGAYQDAYNEEKLNKRIEEAEKAMQSMAERHENAVGALVAMGAEIVSVDIFMTPSIFRVLWPKILRSSVLSSVVTEEGGTITTEDAARYIGEFVNKSYMTRESVDQGRELYYEDDELCINALIHEGGIVHLAAFPVEPVEVGAAGTEDQQLRAEYANQAVLQRAIQTQAVGPASRQR